MVGFSAQKKYAIIAGTISLLAIGFLLLTALHHHNDGLVHNDCPVCVLSSTPVILLNLVIIFAAILAFCYYIAWDNDVNIFPNTFILLSTPRAPPREG
jgi:hypothetical protein